MPQIVETWMLLGQFKKCYPEYQQSYLMKLNEYIVFYEISPCLSEKKETNLLYFSLEDAYKALEYSIKKHHE